MVGRATISTSTAQFIKLKNVRAKPKPYGGTQPVIMNAGASPVGRAFAVRNCDAFFMQSSRVSVEETAQRVAGVKAEAAAQGRAISVFTVGVITCRPTMKEAEEYHHHVVVDQADWAAVDQLLALRNITPQTTPHGRVHAAARRSSRTATAACRSSAIRITSRGS